jgi:spore germination protein YaaH
MKKIFLLSYIIIFTLQIKAQTFKSIQQEEQEYYNSLGLTTDAQFDSLNGTVALPHSERKAGCQLDKIVFGYHPSWVGSTYLNYRWDLLSDLCYFSYEVDSLTGNAVTTHSWATAAVVDTAMAHGVRVHLCVTLMDGLTYFLTHTTPQQTLITNLINLVQSRGADGVNIDFEGVPSSQKTNLTTFLTNLCTQMHNAIPGSKVSIAAPAVNWSGTFDVAALNPYLDWFVIMGYDYYWSGSSTAGPNSGLYSMTCATYDNLSRSITYYLNAGASNSKLVMALPYYGREWHTTSSTVPSSTIAGTSSSRTYKVVRDNVSGYYSTANKHWESNSFTPYYVFNDGSAWHQCFADNEKSLAYRYDMIYMRDIAGIGIWALGYDDTYTELWDLIESKLTNCRTVPCTDTIYDLGGPGCAHFDNENFTYTIAPDGASGLTLDFSSFDLESGWDSLWIYDGPSIASPKIGGYSSTLSPGNIIASGNSLTLKFHSDNATTHAGWQAIWDCSVDNTLPVTAVSANTWETHDFTSDFTDSDNVGVDKLFYQVMDYNGTEWRANGTYGFFNDNFSTAIHPEWTVASGSWSINAAHLNQTDEANGNSNIYAMVNQVAGNTYLYHWQMNIGGTLTNQRAGLHFFCDSANGINRGNSYFVYYRAFDDKVQIYKCIDDAYYIQTNIACTIDLNTWYDCKILFNQTTGNIKAYLDNELISEWTDSSPFTSGNAISLRTGSCNALYDDVKVYHSRTDTALVSIGSGKEVRYQNPDPVTPSCRIRSIITDVSGLWSNVAGTDVNIDWTPPDTVIINDGISTDIDTSIVTTQYDANWNASADPNSGIDTYFIAIGDNPGDTNITAWTNAGNVINYSQGGLSLVPGNIYYFSVKARNGAGLYSPNAHSDGVFIEDISGMQTESALNDLMIFPNPFTNRLNVRFNLNEKTNIAFILSGLNGEIYSTENFSFDSGTRNIIIKTPAGLLGSNQNCILQIFENDKRTRSIILMHSSK